jgi:hypothetical protein
MQNFHQHHFPRLQPQQNLTRRYGRASIRCHLCYCCVQVFAGDGSIAQEINTSDVGFLTGEFRGSAFDDESGLLYVGEGESPVFSAYDLRAGSLRWTAPQPSGLSNVHGIAVLPALNMLVCSGYNNNRLTVRAEDP